MFRMGGSTEGITSGLAAPRTGFKESFFDVGTQSQLTKQWYDSTRLQEEFPTVEEYLEAVAETIKTHESLSSGDQTGMGSSELEDQVEKYNKVIGEVNQATGLNTPKYQVDYDKYTYGEHTVPTRQWGPDRGTTYSPRTKIEGDDSDLDAQGDTANIFNTQGGNQGGNQIRSYGGSGDELITDELIEEFNRAKGKIPFYQRPEGEGLSRFLTSFGLDLMSRPPQGGFLATAAESAKGPTAQLYKDIDTERAMKYQSEADLFNTLVGAKAKIMAERAGNEGAADMFKDEKLAALGTETLNRLFKHNDTWDSKWDKMSEDERLKDPDYVSWQREKKRIDLELDRYQKDVGVDIEFLWGGAKGMEDIQWEISEQLKSSDKPMIGPDGKAMLDEDQEVITEGDFYSDDENRGKLRLKIIEIVQDKIKTAQNRQRGWEGATGGRVGYANGELVEQVGMDVMTPQGNVAMEETVEEGVMPEQLSYQELRSRLPQEISNEIVQLLVSSAEALADFAEIQTQIDVDNFNAKYGVNLLLPSEA